MTQCLKLWCLLTISFTVVKRVVVEGCTHGEIAENPADPSCRSFFLCSHGNRALMTCGPGTIFDMTCLCCNHEAMVTCATDAASLMRNACKQNFGVFPNPADPTCSTFIQCSWGEPYVRNCNPGLVYNPVTGYCDWPANVDCNSKSETTTTKKSTTVKTTTVPPNNNDNNNKNNKNNNNNQKNNNNNNNQKNENNNNINKNGEKRIVCYYPNWAYWRPGIGKYTVGDIDATLCTHIIYSFVVLDADKHTLKTNDEWLDVQKGNFEAFIGLKKSNPNVKLMIALGGWTDSQQKRAAYTKLFTDTKVRATFIGHAMAFMEQWGFDGLDLHFEFPIATDRHGFADWVQSISEAFHGKYELTAAISANVNKIREGLAIPRLSKHLDAIHVMAYDLHGSWEASKADHHAPLYKRNWDTTNLYVDAAVQTLLDMGAPANKLVLGIPTYGRSWSIQIQDNKYKKMTPPIPAKGAAPGGFITKSSGSLAYMEICMKVKNAGWTEVDDLEGPYAYSKDTWVGYDTPGSAADKANYVIERGLGGAMFWDLPQDDFSNQCGKGKYPLIRSVKRVFDQAKKAQ